MSKVEAYISAYIYTSAFSIHAQYCDVNYSTGRAFVNTSGRGPFQGPASVLF